MTTLLGPFLLGVTLAPDTLPRLFTDYEVVSFIDGFEPGVIFLLPLVPMRQELDHLLDSGRVLPLRLERGVQGPEIGSDASYRRCSYS
ncbi:hypothetical protein GGR55DRAFT_654410 [Xylaria sp. FL0064]|nr:hypothetical protein GGR55DRAFT_654410 [Xylaria sp. FL0064]